MHSDAKKHPIENGRALWCENAAPYVDMGTLVFDGGNPDDGADVTEASKVRYTMFCSRWQVRGR